MDLDQNSKQKISKSDILDFSQIYILPVTTLC